MTNTCSGILRELRANGKPENLAGMARFGIETTNSLGLTVSELRRMARAIGRDQALAEELWQTGIRDARILATIIADPKSMRRSTMDRWVADLNSWDVCDACCCNLFDRTAFAWQKIPKWAADKREFVRRSALSTLAGLAVHDKQARDAPFLGALELIEEYAFDERNFVRKAVNWALRNIGKRNQTLLVAAVASAKRIQSQGSKSARWIAADALREFRMKFGV